jgi:hypothetical protein
MDDVNPREEPSALSGEQWRRLRDLFGDVQEMPE